MVINKDVVKYIRAIEASLIESQSIDLNNCYHTAKFLNVEQCKDSLKHCVLSKYCISVYLKYILPMYFYIEYINNYLTIEKIASDQGIPACNAEQLIAKGKEILNTIN